MSNFKIRLTPWEQMIYNVIFGTEEFVSVEVWRVCDPEDEKIYLNELLEAVRKSGTDMRYRSNKKTENGTVWVLEITR